MKRAKKARGQAGRPSDYDPSTLPQVQKLAELGATDVEIAAFLGVNDATLYRWKLKHPAFRDALKLGKEAADDRVEKSLYRRALGYSHDAVKIYADPKTGQEHIVPFVEHYPPDTTACIFWLKNRRRQEWRDKVDHEHTGADGGPIEMKMTETELARRALFLLAKVAGDSNPGA